MESEFFVFENFPEQKQIPMGTKPCQFNETFKTQNQVLVVNNVRQFLMNPFPFGLVMHCKMKRITTGSIFNRQIEFHVLMPSQQIIAFVRPRGDFYDITMASQQGRQIYLASLGNNFLRTEYRLFNDISSQELALILYENNPLGIRGPRQMTVLTPTLNSISCKINLVKYNQEQSKLLKVSNNKFQNKKPLFDKEQKSFVLDFYGRVKIPSVKNFILFHTELQTEHLIFGKIQENQFHMQIKYPLSFVQGLGICVTSVLKKWLVQ